MEREELMRCVLTWLIGPAFDPTPKEVSLILKGLVQTDEYRETKPDDVEIPTSLDPAAWAKVKDFGDIVKFVHQSVEWENLLYFLYPYFWGSDDLAHEKLFLEHPDPGHRDFLRSGFARVVVPIRPGFEEAFVKLTTSGSPGSETPYLTIASEISAYARTNYGAIPPANPEKHGRPQLYTQQRKTWETMQSVIAKIDAFFTAQHKYPADLNALSGGPFKDAWGREFVYKVPGAETEYELISLGADGAKGGTGANAEISAAASATLVGTWWEYTPSSGIDIDVKMIALQAFAGERPLLARGDRGDAVVELQKMLRHVGFDVVIDGKFELRTEDAVKEFQRDHNLEPNGQVGPATWAALDEATQ
jgi:hypothetical protein